MVGIAGQPRRAGRHPKGLVGSDPRKRGETVGHAGELGARDEEVNRGQRGRGSREARCRPADKHLAVPPGLARGRDAELPGQVGARRRQDGPLLGHVTGVDAQQEAHRVEERQQRGRRAGLDVDPGGLTVVEQAQVVLRVPVRAQDERLRGRPRGEGLQMLGREAVQPAQPVGPADSQHTAVRPVDDRDAFGEPALLAQGVAVVRGHPVVRRVGCDRPAAIEQRGAIGAVLPHNRRV